jgi:S1-C subfamily serine protease
MFVPIDLLQPILEDLIRSGRPSTPPQPWLGLSVEETHGRVIVMRVTSGGPAEKAGLKTGDIILAVNKNSVAGLSDFYRKVWSLGKAGVSVPLSVLKDIRIHEVVVQSGDRYRYFEMRAKQ